MVGLIQPPSWSQPPLWPSTSEWTIASWLIASRQRARAKRGHTNNACNTTINQDAGRGMQARIECNKQPINGGNYTTIIALWPSPVEKDHNNQPNKQRETKLIKCGSWGKERHMNNSTMILIQRRG